MNLNPILKELEKELGYPVVQDVYTGEKEIYGVYAYEDERGELYGDDNPIEDTAYMRIQIYTPQNYNYMQLKHQTRNYLEAKGFIITGIRSWLEKKLDRNADQIRCTVMEMKYTDTHEF